MKQLGLHQEVMLMTDLFDIAAKSAGDYGCEIWSTPWLGDWCLHKCDLQILKFHCNTLVRRCLGVSKGTASLLSVLAECGKYPLQIHWLTRTAKYWNKLVTMQANITLLTEAFSCMCDNLHLGLVLDACSLLDGARNCCKG